jgi:integrase
MFTAIARDERALGRPVGAATLKRIHVTLRAVLNGAVRAGLIPSNPGRFPELPKAPRPRPQVGTPALTGRWEREGWRPDIGVWTAGQTAAFLACVRQHRLYALFHLVALRGLRRGEAAGLAWTDLKVVQDQLGHSTIVLTADTYTSVLPETAITAAERTAALLFPTSGCPAKGVGCSSPEGTSDLQLCLISG